MTKVRRVSAPIRAQAVSLIRDKILNGEFYPGMRLVESKLEEELGVSRTTIREALRYLEAARLVQAEPHVGLVVSTLTGAQIRELYEARMAMEGALARLAAINGTDKQKKKIRAVYETLTKLESTESQVEKKTEFYRALVDAAHNEILGEILENIQDRTALLRSLTLSVPGRHDVSVREIEDVVHAIEVGDAVSAEEAARRHVNEAADVAMKLFNDDLYPKPSAELAQKDVS